MKINVVIKTVIMHESQNEYGEVFKGNDIISEDSETTVTADDHDDINE
jgi:hypothetical protein